MGLCSVQILPNAALILLGINENPNYYFNKIKVISWGKGCQFDCCSAKIKIFHIFHAWLVLLQFLKPAMPIQRQLFNSQDSQQWCLLKLLFLLALSVWVTFPVITMKWHMTALYCFHTLKFHKWFILFFAFMRQHDLRLRLFIFPTMFPFVSDINLMYNSWFSNDMMIITLLYQYHVYNSDREMTVCDFPSKMARPSCLNNKMNPILCLCLSNGHRDTPWLNTPTDLLRCDES